MGRGPEQFSTVRIYTISLLTERRKSNEVKIYFFLKNTDATGKHFKSRLRATRITMAK